MLVSRRLAPLILLIWPLFFLDAQGSADKADPVSFIGISLDELIDGFGAPSSVYSSRGLEEWQDDVVFVYEEGDFYIYKNRVWQLGLRSFRGINSGDPRGVVSLILGAGAEERQNSVFFSLEERAWPMMMRCDFDEAGKVQAVFIYRTDL